jgi:hypothetical protein
MRGFIISPSSKGLGCIQGTISVAHNDRRRTLLPPAGLTHIEAGLIA